MNPMPPVTTRTLNDKAADGSPRNVHARNSTTATVRGSADECRDPWVKVLREAAPKQELKLNEDRECDQCDRIEDWMQILRLTVQSIVSQRVANVGDGADEDEHQKEPITHMTQFLLASLHDEILQDVRLDHGDFAGIEPPRLARLE